MHDALRMGQCQGIEYRQGQGHGLARRHRAMQSQLLGQGRALDQLEYQVGPALQCIGLEQGHDVGMCQAADGACLVQPLVLRQAVGTGVEQLDRDLTVQPLVVRAPDRGLSTAPKLIEQAKPGQALARHGAFSERGHARLAGSASRADAAREAGAAAPASACCTSCKVTRNARP